MIGLKLKIITIITTIYVSTLLYISRNNKKVFSFYLGCIAFGWISGAILGTGSAIFMDIFYPPDITGLEEANNFLDKIPGQESPEATQKNLNDEELNQARKTNKRWLLLLFLAYYFLTQT